MHTAIDHAIQHQAQAQGDHPALVSLDGETTFAQLHSCIARFAGQLADAGLKREDRVGLLVPAGVPGAQLVVALASNTTLVPINPALTPSEIAAVTRLSDLRAMIIPDWIDSQAARAALQEQKIALIGAVLAPDGAVSLEVAPPAVPSSSSLRPANGSDIALLLRSSGTTGTPKLIPVTHGNLVAMAQKMGSEFWYALGTQDRAACILPLYYAAGLKTTLFVPLIVGASVAFPPAGQGLDITRWVGSLKPTYFTVAPGSLNGIVDRLRASAHDFDPGSLRFIMCGSAYLPEEVRLAAQSLLHVPVLEFYGLSEAGVMAANPVRPHANKPGTVGLPPPGELLIVDDEAQRVPDGTVGQIMISGPTVMPGHMGTDSSGPDGMKDGWLMTGDLGRLDEDGYLTIVGRMSEVINRGGEKVFPYEVEKALLEHPAVLEAAAFGVPHPRLGENVAAAVVLKPAATVSEHELKTFIAGRLSGFKQPRSVQFVQSLPRGSTGKVLRRSLGEAHAARPHEAAPPQEWLEFELLALWQRLLGTSDIGVDDDFFEIGGDSLLATEVLMEVEQLAGRPYPQSELATFTIRHITDVVASGLAAQRDVITQVKSGSGVPLFFCHGDYAERGLYAQKLAALLPQEQPMFLLHCYSDRMLGTSIEEMAQIYLQEVLRAAPGSPVIVGGYCNGGLVAWHLAHLLRARGIEVLELFLVETMSLNARPLLRRLPGLVAAAASVLPGRAGRLVRDDGMRAAWIIRRMGIAGFAAKLYGAARRRTLPTPQQEPAPGPRLDAHRAAKRYYQLMACYVPPPLDVPVTCFLAEKCERLDVDPGFWRDLAPVVREVSTPGSHHTMLMSERPALARALAEALQRAVAHHLLRVDAGKDKTVAAPPALTSTLASQ